MTDQESLGSSISGSNAHSDTPKFTDPQPLHENTDLEKANVAEIGETDGRLPDPSDLDTQRTQSIISLRTQPSAKSARSADQVPLSERRGLLSSVTLLPEITNARNYKSSQKLIVVLIVAFAAVAGPMGTTIILPAIDDLTTNLHTTVAKINISVGIYSLSLGIFPLWWSNFSEKHGRRSVYVISYTWFLAFSVACAVAPNIEGLIVLRLLAGVGASAIQSCGAGTIADLYVQEERGAALGLFYLGPLLGPFLSPIIGGAVAEGWGWRATMWVMVIVCGLNLVSIIFLLPETLPKINRELIEMMVNDTVAKADDIPERDLERIISNASQNSSLRRQALDEVTPVGISVPMLSRVSTTQTMQSSYGRQVRDAELAILENAPPAKPTKTWQSNAYDYVIRPLHAVVFLGYPPFLMVLIYSSISFMGIFLLNISTSNRYSVAPYNFSPVIVGLMYIPNSISFILTSIFGGRWNDRLIKRYAKLHNGELNPEARLSWNIVTAAVIYPIACMIFGWCLDKKQFWVTPLIGSALLGVSAMLNHGATLTYCVDVLPGKGATGVALNNLSRQILAATATFITEPIASAVGTGVLFSIYAGVVTLASLLILYLKRRGPQFREKYDITTYYAKL